MSASMKAKIAALRAKRSAAGCTEAEALAAAELAARLMRDHGLSEADLVMTEAEIPDPTTRATWRSSLSSVIAYVTNTASIVLQDGRNGSIVQYIGIAPGPEIAVYLRDLTFRAVLREVKDFKAGAFYRRRRTLKTKRQASADFIDGLVLRLRRRLIEIFEPTVNPTAKAEAIAVRDARFPTAQDHKAPKREARFSEATNAGWRAGGNIPLNRGVATAPPRQLSLLGEA